MRVFDLGDGPFLYVGGTFSSIGTVGFGSSNIARYDGASWSPLGTGVSGVGALVYTLMAHDGVLYAGGTFASAGAMTVDNIASWDGATWSGLGTGMTGSRIIFTLPYVSAVVMFDDGLGGGPNLYAGGNFTQAGGVTVNSIARWNGTSWSSLGNGVSGSNASVDAMAVYDDGSGSALFAGGTFTTIDGVVYNRLAKWNGQAWQQMGRGVNGKVEVMGTFDLGDGPALYVGGQFNLAGNDPNVTHDISVRNIVKWTGQAGFTPFITPNFNGVGGLVLSFAHADIGNGPQFYVGGGYTTAGSVPDTNRIAMWNGPTSGGAWTPLGTGCNERVWTMAEFEGQLYAGGIFTTANGDPADRIAIWSCPTASCYANCDNSTTDPILNVEDFTCFINEFAAGSILPPAQQLGHIANCDGSSTEPILNVEDFICFINMFAAGCP